MNADVVIVMYTEVTLSVNEITKIRNLVSTATPYAVIHWQLLHFGRRL